MEPIEVKRSVGYEYRRTSGHRGKTINVVVASFTIEPEYRDVLKTAMDRFLVGRGGYYGRLENLSHPSQLKHFVALKQYKAVEIVCLPENLEPLEKECQLFLETIRATYEAFVNLTGTTKFSVVAEEIESKKRILVVVG